MSEPTMLSVDDDNRALGDAECFFEMLAPCSVFLILGRIERRRWRLQERLGLDDLGCGRIDDLVKGVADTLAPCDVAGREAFDDGFDELEGTQYCGCCW